MSPPRSRLLPYLVVALAAVAVHLRTLAFPFVFDDEWLVVRNAFLRAPWSVVTAFAHHFWYGTPFDTGYYRPIVVASFALQGRLFGWGPAGFHLVNVLLHAANATLVLRLLRRYGVGIGAATFGALFFALHPAAAWPVGSVVARVDLLPALCVLLAWNALVSERGGMTGAWMTGGFFAAALLCKESAVAFLGVPFMALRTRRPPVYAAVACVAGLALALAARYLAGVPLAPPASAIDPLVNPLAALPQPGRMLAALVLSGRYLLYLIVPIRFVDPVGYGAGAAMRAAHPAGVLGSAALLFIWVALVVVLWLRRDRLSLFLGFSLAAFLPASNLLVPVGSLYAQNFLYMPLVGWSLAAGDLAGWLVQRRSGARVITTTVAAVLLALLATATVLETRVWSDATTLFTAWTKRFPRYALGWSRLGVARLDAGQPVEAERILRRSLRLEERNAEAHYNLGVALLMTATDDQKDRIEEGLKESRRASELSPDLVQAHVNASHALLRLERPAEAETEARAALAAAPGFAPARRNLAEALFREKRYADAVPLFRELVAESPHDPNLRSPLVVSLIDANLLDEARAEAEAARREFPGMAWFDFCLARVEARSGHRAAAIGLLGRAAAAEPQVRDWMAKVPDFAGYPQPRPR